MKNSARLFNCARCQRQTLICSDCDRGNIYCSSTCASIARKGSLSESARRYQKTRRGSHQHAKRQQRYRQLQKKKVTHQGSPDLNTHDVLTETQNVHKNPIVDTQICHFCKKPCSTYLRVEFLQHSK